MKKRALPKFKHIELREAKHIHPVPPVYGFIKIARVLGVVFFLIGIFFVMGAFFDISITVYSVSEVKSLASIAGILLEVIGIVLLVIKIREPELTHEQKNPKNIS